MKKIIMLSLLLSIYSIAEDFELRGTMVYDKKTKLSWEAIPHKNKMQWSKAIEHCKAKKLRLPNLNELSSLLNYSQSRPSVRTDKIHFISDVWYWTSSIFRDSSDLRWFVDIYRGANGWTKKETQNAVICVKG